MKAIKVTMSLELPDGNQLHVDGGMDLGGQYPAVDMAVLKAIVGDKAVLEEVLTATAQEMVSEMMALKGRWDRDRANK